MKGQAVVSTMLFLIMMVCQANAQNCSDLNAVVSNMTAMEKRCYDNVLWAKETGCKSNPQWYVDEGIMGCSNGSILDFQCALWKMRGKHREGEAHNCTRPCGSHLCDEEELQRARAANHSESEGSGFPFWSIALIALAIAATCGIGVVAFLWCRGEGGEKKKKKRGIAKERKPKASADVEENTESQSLAPPESPAASAAPALTAQPIIVHHTLPQVGSGSFVAQAMPVAMSHPVMTHSFPVPSFTTLPAATENVLTQAHPIAHAYATTSGVATHMVTPVGSASVTPVPAISTPVAYYQHQGQGAVFQQ